MQTTLNWLLDLDKPIPGGGLDTSFRSQYEETIRTREQKIERGMAWAVKEAEEKLTPPPLDEVTDAALKCGMSEDAVEWVGIQLMMFLEMSRQRGRGQSMQPLSFQDLDCYQRLNKIEFHQVELSNILLLDQIFMTFCSEMIKQQVAEAKAKTGA